jgi:hypothetical protein
MSPKLSMRGILKEISLLADLASTYETCEAQGIANPEMDAMLAEMKSASSRLVAEVLHKQGAVMYEKCSCNHCPVPDKAMLHACESHETRA